MPQFNFPVEQKYIVGRVVRNPEIIVHYSSLAGYVQVEKLTIHPDLLTYMQMGTELKAEIEMEAERHYKWNKEKAINYCSNNMSETCEHSDRVQGAPTFITLFNNKLTGS